MPKIIPTTKPDFNKTIDYKWLGQYIRFKRTSLGIGVVEAAAMCGLSKTAYSNVELGKNSRIKTLFTVLTNFGVQLSVKQGSDELEDTIEWH